MSLLRGFDKMQLVKVGPSLRERLEQMATANYRLLTIARLRRYRRTVEQDMKPEAWTALEAPMALTLAEICGALGLSESERARVIGREGERMLAELIESRPVGRLFLEPISERQMEALRYVERHGQINLSTYRALCPLWSDETLRLDLVGLVGLGFLVKNGDTKGTYYTAVDR
jgi:hypothetical protein